MHTMYHRYLVVEDLSPDDMEVKNEEENVETEVQVLPANTEQNHNDRCTTKKQL